MRKPPSIDERIVALLAQAPNPLHDLVLALWPGLDEGPRDTAHTAIYYVRYRVAALRQAGCVVLDGSMLYAVRAGEIVRPALPAPVAYV